MKSKTYSAVEIYTSNHGVSVAAAQMAEHIDKLRQAGLIVPDQAQFRLAWIEEIRAMTCHDVNNGMDWAEVTNAAAAEKRRLPIERKWAKLAGDDLPTEGKMKEEASKRKSRAAKR